MISLLFSCEQDENGRHFDLNIDDSRYLSNWSIPFALREIISNAFDEQLLSNTADILIESRGNLSIIKDYGRGLGFEHLRQNESDEKKQDNFAFGQFGVGVTIINLVGYVETRSQRRTGCLDSERNLGAHSLK